MLIFIALKRNGIVKMKSHDWYVHIWCNVVRDHALFAVEIGRWLSGCGNTIGKWKKMMPNNNNNITRYAHCTSNNTKWPHLDALTYTRIHCIHYYHELLLFMRALNIILCKSLLHSRSLSIFHTIPVSTHIINASHVHELSWMG